MTDDNLIEVSQQIDTHFTLLMDQYGISPLSLAAIVLARILVINKELGSMDEFLSLLNSVSANPPPTEIETQVH